MKFEFLDLADFRGVAFQWLPVKRKAVALVGDLVVEDVEVCLRQLQYVAPIFHMKIHYHNYRYYVYCKYDYFTGEKGRQLR